MRTQDFGECLKELGFSDFVGVPCSYLAPFINWAINDGRFIMANNEGEAVAIASGISLACGCNSSLDNHFVDLSNRHKARTKSPLTLCQFAKNYESNTANTRIDLVSNEIVETSTRKFGVVLMQNSGLSNALSPLTSLNHTFEIPILGFVSLRGKPDEKGQNTDEPQHELMGKITEKMLKLCEIKCEFLSHNLQTATKQLYRAKEVLERGKTFFFIVDKSCFEAVKLEKNPLNTQRREFLPTRLQALQSIQKIAFNATLLATTGKSGRELYELDDKENQLYMVGSMGCVSALGLGIALKSHKKIIAIDGDSALLMRLGALSGNAYYAKCDNKGNFCHILLDNESHDSTGGQFNLSPFVDFVAVAKSCGYENVIKAENLKEFENALNAFMKAQNGGAFFIYLKIAKGSKENLGRPKITPKQVAKRFAVWLAK